MRGEMERVIQEAASDYDIAGNYYSKEHNTCVYELLTTVRPNYRNKYRCWQYDPVKEELNLSIKDFLDDSKMEQLMQQEKLREEDARYTRCENDRENDEKENTYRVKVLYDIVGRRDISRSKVEN